MRYQQIKPLSEQRLDEINMSPASLRQLASKIQGAKAGLEFELVVRGMGGTDDDNLVADYAADVRPQSINSIIDFFDDGEYNGPAEIRNLREKLEEEFYDWHSTELADDFKNDSDAIAALADQVKDENDELSINELNAAVAYEIKSQGSIYQDLREEWDDEHRDDYDDEAWLRSSPAPYRNMSDIEGVEGITWPHWSYAASNGTGADDITASFEAAVGRPVQVSTGYHDRKISRQTVGDEFYIAEPDSSIDTDDDDDSGLEFVSPPLSINDMITDLRKVADWCNAGNAYTNESTGLHMNISIPNYDQAKLDFVKLAILMGDNHVSSSFGRLGNTYAKSAMDIVKNKIRTNPESALGLLTQMKSHLNTAASRIIHDASTSKYTSINVKDGRVEFRSPGGNWLTDVTKVENTLLRFVVALDAAMDETKYKEEYAKKLYKMLAPTGRDDSTVQHFAQFAAGQLPRSALVSFVRDTQRVRQNQRQPQSAVHVPEFEIYNRATDQQVHTFDAPSAQQAAPVLRAYLTQHGVSFSEYGARTTMAGDDERRTNARNSAANVPASIEQSGGIATVEQE